MHTRSAIVRNGTFTATQVAIASIRMENEAVC